MITMMMTSGAGGMDWDNCFAILMGERITTILDLTCWYW
jgi:hypothetical protein